jgi:hypothetical protein
VIAKVEWHQGELFPRVGFVVTNMSAKAKNVVRFYNKRGNCEQWETYVELNISLLMLSVH